MQSVIVKCVDCSGKREIKPGEIEEGAMPICANCGGVMIADVARSKNN